MRSTKQTPRVRQLRNEAARQFAAQHITDPMLDAEVLLSCALRCDRTWLRAHDDAAVAQHARRTFLRMVRQRLRYMPVAYITGEQEFYGRVFAVNHAVLIPRPKTELLIEAALAHIAARSTAVIADIGTGSGNIAVTIAAERPRVRVLATETSFRALAVARANAKKHRVTSRIRFFRGNLLRPLRDQSFDILLANLPYVPTRRSARSAAERAALHEPLLARSGTRHNTNGTAVLRSLLTQLEARAQKPHIILLETDYTHERTLHKAAARLAPSWQWRWITPLGEQGKVLQGASYGSSHQQ